MTKVQEVQADALKLVRKERSVAMADAVVRLAKRRRLPDEDVRRALRILIQRGPLVLGSDFRLRERAERKASLVR